MILETLVYMYICVYESSYLIVLTYHYCVELFACLYIWLSYHHVGCSFSLVCVLASRSGLFVPLKSCSTSLLSSFGVWFGALWYWIWFNLLPLLLILFESCFMRIFMCGLMVLFHWLVELPYSPDPSLFACWFASS